MSPLADISGYKLQTGANTGKISCSLRLPKEPAQTGGRVPSHHLARCGRCLPQRLCLAAWGNETSSQPLLAEGSGWAGQASLNTTDTSGDLPARSYSGVAN